MSEFEQVQIANLMLRIEKLEKDSHPPVNHEKLFRKIVMEILQNEP